MGDHEEMFELLASYLDNLDTAQLDRIVFCGDGGKLQVGGLKLDEDRQQVITESGESLFLRKIFPGILLGKIGKNVRDRLCLRRPRFVLVTSSRPNKGSRHRLQMT